MKCSWLATASKYAVAQLRPTVRQVLTQIAECSFIPPLRNKCQLPPSHHSTFPSSHFTRKTHCSPPRSGQVASACAVMPKSDLGMHHSSSKLAQGEKRATSFDWDNWFHTVPQLSLIEHHSQCSKPLRTLPSKRNSLESDNQQVREVKQICFRRKSGPRTKTKDLNKLMLTNIVVSSSAETSFRAAS